METDTQDSNGGLEFRWVQTLQLRMFLYAILCFTSFTCDGRILFSLFSSDDSLTVLILAASWREAGRGRSTGRGRSSARGRSLARTPQRGRASPPRQPRPRRRRCCRASPARARRWPAACRATTSSQPQRTQHRTHPHFTSDNFNICDNLAQF